MSKGDKRKQIMEICPEEFEEDLKKFIDDIEASVNNILDKLSITDITQMTNIEDAYTMTDDLADSLY